MQRDNRYFCDSCSRKIPKPERVYRVKAEGQNLFEQRIEPKRNPPLHFCEPPSPEDCAGSYSLAKRVGLVSEALVPVA